MQVAPSKSRVGAAGCLSVPCSRPEPTETGQTPPEEFVLGARMRVQRGYGPYSNRPEPQHPVFGRHAAYYMLWCVGTAYRNRVDPPVKPG